MNAPPQDNPDNTHRRRTKVVAYLGAPDADTVDLEEESEEWRVETVHNGLGAQSYALLRRDLAQAGKRIENRKLNPHGTRIVEIWSLDEDGNRQLPLLRGELMGGDVHISTGEEHETAFVILPPAWFGDLCEGQQVWNPIAQDLEIVHLDLAFNPLVDGRLLGTCARHDPEVVGVEHSLWIDPESCRTDEAARAAGLVTGRANVIKWTVDRAIESLQAYLNPDQTYIENFPTREARNDPRDPQFDASPDLEDLTLPRGQYLSAYLDALLPAYGHQWTVDFNTDEEATAITPRIHVMRRGEGTKRVIPYQKIGEDLDTSKTQPLSVDISVDVSQLANIVVAQGSLIEREVTIELKRGWPEERDEAALTDLDKTPTSYDAANDPVWRKWVGNEAGDYIGLRSELTEPLDLSTEFPEGYVPKRRPVEDCLTFRSGTEQEAARQPPLLEYSINGGTSWKRAGHDWRPLTHEFGVYLTDPKAGGLVKLLHDAGENARLRLTGTIRGDKRIEHEVDRTEDSPTSIETRLFLDLSHRFHKRGRATSTMSGEFDEAADQTALEDFLEKVADSTKAAVIGSQLPLDGLVFEYLIGDVIENIQGRNLSLNRLATDAEKRGVQIVGITWHIDRQRTLLTVTPFDTFATASLGGSA